MRPLVPAIVLLAGLASGTALAQTAPPAPSGAYRSGEDTLLRQPRSDRASNIGPRDTRSVVAPSLPVPPLDHDAAPADFLRAAQGALAAGRTGEAQSALEMAQTRLLDRSVPLGQTGVPSDNSTVRQISQALNALGAGDRATSMQLIQVALQSIGTP